MPSRQISRCPLLVVILLLVTFLAGCSFTVGGNKSKRSSRGKVSDVAKAAAPAKQSESRTKIQPETSGNTWLTPERSQEEDDDDSLALSALMGASLAADGDADSSTPTERPNVMMWYAQADPGGDTVERLTSYTLAYSAFQGDRIRVHLGLYYGDAKRGRQLLVSEGMNTIREYGVDIGGRHYLTAGHTMAGVYVLGGMRAGQLYWTYANPVVVVDSQGTETINNDAVWLGVPYLGLGLSPVQTETTHFGLNLTYGGRFSYSETTQGFENDVFKDVGELKLNVEAGVFF